MLDIDCTTWANGLSMATRKVELPLTVRAAEVRPDSLDEERRTVDVVWTTGARVRRGFFNRYWEELSLDPSHVRMDRLNAGAPLVDSHRSYETRGVIGVVESARLEKTQGIATVRFARDDAAAEAIWRKVKDRILRNVSVGYATHRLEKTEDDADEIPVYRATDWEPMELSVVPIGADAGAQVRSADQLYECEIIEETDMAKTRAGDTARDPAPPEQRGESEGEVITSNLHVHVTEDARGTDQVLAAERERAAVLIRTCRALELPGELADEHIAAGTSADAFRELAIEQHARATPPVASPGGPPITPGDDARDKYREQAVAWLVQRSGASGDGDPGPLRGRSLMRIAEDCLRAAGQRVDGRRPLELASMALRGVMGAAATGDFPVILENTLHKLLLAAYATAPDTWRRFCATGSVSDFRPHPRYRLGSFGAIQTVPEGAEFRNQSIPDARKESITAATKGSMITITRQALINDDMGAFSRLATMLGRAAGLAIEEDVYALLALNSGLGPAMNDTNPLFDASHSNISGGAALTAAAIDDDRVVLASQTDESNQEILDLRPAVLVVPIGLGSTARTINDAQYDPDSTGALSPNTVRGLFADIVDTPRMTGTRRYLFADPAIAPTLEVAFLDGQQMPYMEMQEGWRVDGVEWKVRLDYAVGAIDYRGAVTDAGA